MEKKLTLFGNCRIPVCPNGYDWIDAIVREPIGSQTCRAELLVQRSPEGPCPTDEAPCWYYDPMDELAIARIFAEIPISKEGIVAFCNKYGSLGMRSVQLVSPAEVSETVIGAYERMDWWGDTLGVWRYHITKVGTLLRLHDALGSDSPASRLASLVHGLPRYDPRGNPTDDSRREVRPISHFDGTYRWTTFEPYDLRLEFSDPYHEWEPGSPMPDEYELRDNFNVSAAWDFLTFQVNEELRRGARPFIRRVRETQSGLRISPTSLLGAIYAHIGLAVVGQAPRLLSCRNCYEWFAPADPRQIYCEEKCRVGAHRKRKKAAERDQVAIRKADHQIALVEADRMDGCCKSP